MSDSPKPTPASGDGAAGAPVDAPELAKEARETPPRTDGDGQTQLAAGPAQPEVRESSIGFPVVGVGASAGGLEALESFLSRLPRTGMAFVVIQHLSPDFRSLMDELLEFLDDVVDELGSRREAEAVNWILQNGTGADRQLRVFETSGGDLKKVVDFICEETRHGLPIETPLERTAS